MSSSSMRHQRVQVVSDMVTYMHPASAPGRCSIAHQFWLIYHELILTTRKYCHNVLAVEPNRTAVLQGGRREQDQ